MKFSDSLRLSYFIFRRNKLRTGLTVLGVSVGIGVIVFLLSFGYGLERITLARITAADSLFAIDVSSVDVEHPLDDEAVTQLQAIPRVQVVDPVIQLPAQIDGDNEFIDLAGMWGASARFFSLEGLAFTHGQPFNDTNGVVISKAVADTLKASPESMVGKELDFKVFAANDDSGNGVDVANLIVTGVVEHDVPVVYVTREILTSYSDGTYHLLKVKAQSQQDVAAIKDAIATIGFQAQSTLDDVGKLTRGFTIARVVLGVFGLIAVIVSSIGMFNTMTISLLERIKEIGIMKALGASDRDIWVLFLTEAGLIGGIGGLGGVVIGKLTIEMFNGLFNVISQRAGGPTVALFYTPAAFVAAMFLFGAIVGIITGVYPARRGAKLNPLEALRYE